MSRGGDDVDEPKSPNAEVTTKSMVHHGSIKKQKRRQAIHLSSDSEGKEIAAGVGRSCALKRKGKRHFFARSGLEYTADCLSVQKRVPEWMDESGKWLDDLRGTTEKPNVILINGIPIDGVGAHLGFIFLPTGHRTSLSEKRVPAWNVWREKLPYYFFGATRTILADDGYLAVIHSSDFNHMNSIGAAMNSKKKFKHVRQHSMLLSKPLYQADMDIKVRVD